MVAGVGLSQLGELVRCSPVEVSAIHNHTADGGSVSTDKFSCRMYDNIGTVLNGANQIRGCKSVIY